MPFDRRLGPHSLVSCAEAAHRDCIQRMAHMAESSHIRIVFDLDFSLRLRHLHRYFHYDPTRQATLRKVTAVMSMLSNSPHPLPESSHPLPSSTEEIDFGQSAGWRWAHSRARPPNAEQAMLLSPRSSLDPKLSHNSWKITTTVEEDGDMTLCFPRTFLCTPLTIGTYHQKLPDPFTTRYESMKLHTFRFAEPVEWTNEAQTSAKAAFEQQIKSQLNPEIGAEPHIYFPSTASDSLNVTFSNVKRFSEGHRLQLEWEGRPVLQDKIGTFLPDDHLVLGFRAVAPDVYLVGLLAMVLGQLDHVLSFKAVQVIDKDDSGNSIKRRVLMLGVFKDKSVHAGMLPGWVGYDARRYRLHFEDRDDVCEVCRLKNLHPRVA